MKNLEMYSKKREFVNQVGAVELKNRLEHNGAVLLRDYKASKNKFLDFAQKHSSHLVRTLPNVAADQSGYCAMVAANKENMHIAHDALPFTPTGQWFYCKKASSVSARTLLCDGVSVWEDFKKQTQKQLQDWSLKYVDHYPESFWKPYVKNEFVGIGNDQEVSEEYLHRISAMYPNQRYQLCADNSLYFELTKPFIRQTRLGHRQAFVNNILSHTKASLANGEPFPALLLEEVQASIDKHTHEIHWQDGDILLIDNTRVLHARPQQTPPHQILYSLQSYLK